MLLLNTTNEEGTVMYKVLIVCNDMNKADTIYESVLQTKNYAKKVNPKSSESLLELFEMEKFDILFISIEQININGIDIASKIKEKNKYLHIVFVSDYDNFEFLRKAVQLGVDDYFLERIIQADVIDTINNICSKIDKEKEEVKQIEKKDEMIKEMYNLASTSFIYSTIFNTKMKLDIDYYKKILGLLDKGFFLNIGIDDNVVNSLDVVNANENIKEALKDDYKFIVGPKILNRIVIYISIDESILEKNKSIVDTNANNINETDIDTSFLEDIKEEIASRLVTYFKSKYDIDIKIGLGSVQSIEKAYTSYEDSITSFFEKKQKNSTELSENGKLKSYLDYTKYINLQKHLLESIELGKDDVVEEFIATLSMLSKLETEEKRNKILESLVLICYTVNKQGISECSFVDYSYLYEEFKQINDKEVDSWALNKFHYIIKSARKRDTDGMSELVKKAIYYIREHYEENISLNDVAGVVGVSLQYFSKIFKDETGKNYVEWLNRFRIEKAKDLMNETSLTIKEVCFKVGYNDPNYFSRIFKKYEGVAPTDYINKKG